MQLVVWNSQGAKWDDLWTHYYSPLLGKGEDVIGLVVESGWAPWVRSTEVHVDAVYGFNTDWDWFNPDGAKKSVFFNGVVGEHNCLAFWVPWRKSLDSEWSNSRCSMGCVMTANTRTVSTKRYVSPDPGMYLRSVFQFSLSIRTGHGYQTDISVFLVHLVSGNPGRAQLQVDDLTRRIRQMVPEGTGAIVVGDFNINLLTTAITIPRNWSVLRTNQPTQQSGGELDYALLFDPHNAYGGSTVTLVESFKTGNNNSDHAVLRYRVKL